MEDHSWEIIDNVKQEPEVQFTLNLSQHLKSDSLPFDQLTLKQIVDNIRPEPEVDFTLTLLQYLKSDGDNSISLEQFTSEEIIANIKLESEVENIESHVHLTTNQIIDNIKHEPEENFTLTLPEDSEPENEELKEVKVVLQKSKPKCKKCGLVINLKIQIKNCKLCGFKFECTKCKKTHIEKDHRKGSTWCCIKCDRSFATKDGLREHESKVHSKMKVYCDICGRTFKAKTYLRRHFQTHFKIPCPICQKKFISRALKEHIRQHSSLKTFKCDECEKVYINKDRLNNHKTQNHKIDQVQCDMCSKIFKNKYFFRHHIRTHFKFPCPYCTKSMGKNNLERHIKSAHPSGEKFLACNIARCQQTFRNIKELKDHKEIHIGTEIYKCPKCNHQTKEINLMKNHMEKHGHLTSNQIIKNIKQEPKANFALRQIIDHSKHEGEVDFSLTLTKYLKSNGDDSITLEQLLPNQLFGNIKHESEEHFTLTLPKESEPEIDLLKEVKVVLRRFDRGKINKHKLFQSFNVYTTSLDQFMSNQEINNNIKHEPEENFTLTLPEESNSEMDKAKEVDFRWTLPEQNIEHQKIVKE